MASFSLIDLFQPQQPRVFGYARVGGKEDETLEAQTKAIEQAAAKLYPNHQFVGMAWDARVAGRIHWFNRKAGRWLMTHLCRGDVVIVQSLDRIVHKWRQIPGILRNIQAGGWELRLLTWPFDLAASIGDFAAITPEEAERLNRRLIGASIADRVAWNHSKGRFPHRPSLGFRVSQNRLVAADWHRQTVEYLAERKAQLGLSWHGLYQFCRRHGHAHPQGGEWTPPRLRRAFAAMEQGWPCKIGWVPSEEGTMVPRLNAQAG